MNDFIIIISSISSISVLWILYVFIAPVILVFCNTIYPLIIFTSLCIYTPFYVYGLVFGLLGYILGTVLFIILITSVYWRNTIIASWGLAIEAYIKYIQNLINKRDNK